MDINKATEAARRRYDRIAPLYDIMVGLVEKRFRKWRQMMWSKVEGRHILEVGVGTGKNLPYYPSHAEVVAVDFSGGMLKRARSLAARGKASVSLRQMDIQKLEFEDNAFDTVAASFVFCSVPDPVRGLMEIERVCKPGGKVVLLEHVISANPVLAWLMNLVNPVAVWFGGENINRRTADNVRKSGLVVERVTDLAGGIVKLIEARKKR
ncbi:MAG: methyltransferase domain-containing protein [Chloroflexi bacterium]|nr:methyltransferase domain-containing protein [Chloroflexota bacterium]